jgi:hypothetical protein
LIETAVPGFHVKYRNLSPLRRQRRKATVRVTQDQDRLRRALLKDGINVDDDLSDRLCRGLPRRIQIVIGGAELQIPEEDLVKLKIMVLPGVHKQVIGFPVKHRNDPGKTDNLRSRSHNRHYSEAFH